MTKVGPCKIVIEPHHFDGMIYTVKDPSAKPQVQIPPQQRMVHYGPPPPTPPYQYQHYTPPNHMRQPPYNPSLPPHPPQAYPQQPRPAPPPVQHPVQRPATAQPATQPSPQQQPPKPSPDPVIQMLATRAASNPELKALMRVVASSKATQEQLRAFQAHIDELNAIIRSREEQQRRQQQQQSYSPQAQVADQSQQAPAQIQQGQPPSTSRPATPAGPSSQPATPSQPPAQTPANGAVPLAAPAQAPPVGSAPTGNTASVQTEAGGPSALPVANGVSPSPGPAPSPSPALNGPMSPASPMPQSLPPNPSPMPSPYPPGPPYTHYQPPPYPPAPMKARNGPFQPPGTYYQSGPSQAPPRLPIKSVVFEFTSPLTPYGSSTSGHAGSGDRYLFPEYSILEYQAGGTVLIASFLITRKVDPNTKFPIESAPELGSKSRSKKLAKPKKKDKDSNTSTPAPEQAPTGGNEQESKPGEASETTDPPATPTNGGETSQQQQSNPRELKEYYQPITMRFYSNKPSILEPFSRVVKPPDVVRKYMEEVMERAERAPAGFLAYRLPRTEDAERQAQQEAKEMEIGAMSSSASAPPDQSESTAPPEPEDEVEEEPYEDELKDFYGEVCGLVPLQA